MLSRRDTAARPSTRHTVEERQPLDRLLLGLDPDLLRAPHRQRHPGRLADILPMRPVGKVTAIEP
jgi:hypothetical protein